MHAGRWGQLCPEILVHHKYTVSLFLTKMPSRLMGKGKSFQQIVLQLLNIHVEKKMNLIITHKKINLRGSQI